MPQAVKVAKHGELKPGEGKAVEVNNVAVALFYVDGKYFAVADSCCHRGGPLSEGTVDGLAVACPWHAWEFDLATGACLTNPGAKQPVFEVKLEGEDVLVVLPD
ncbi:MAG: Rieske (2Fe-2S) protein [Candidatus Sumerlaeaceae bacterium]